MEHNFREAGYALFVAMMALAVVTGGVAGAAPSVTTSSSPGEETTYSELQSGDTIGANNTFTANQSKATVIQYVADSNESKVTIAVNSTGQVVYTNTSATQVAWNTSAGQGDFNVSVNHGALADVERGINENVTVDVTIVNNTSAASPANVTFQAYIESDNSTSVEIVTTEDVGDNGIATVENSTFTLAGFTIDTLSDDYTNVQTENRSVNGSQTNVVVGFENASVQDDYSSVASGASSGDLMLGMSTVVSTGDGTTVPVMVYKGSAPDSVGNDTTYGVYKENYGGQPAIVLHLGSQFDNADSVEVRTIGSADFWQQRSIYGTLTVLTDGQVNFKMSMPLSMSGLGGVSLSGGLMASLAFGAPTARRRKVEDVIITDDDDEE